MADFSLAYDLILKIEGGYQINSLDNGNYACGQLVGTNYGISAIAYQDWIGRCPTVADMQNITPLIARQIYKAKYWDKIRGDDFTNQNTANMLFDMQVNHPSYFNGIVMDAVVAQRKYINTTFALPFDDGEIATINSLNQRTFFDDVKDGREAAYRMQVVTHPDQIVFLNGWLARLRTLEWNEKWKEPVKFLIIALIIVALGAGVFWYISNRKKLKLP
jgi:lysozyme family protein